MPIAKYFLQPQKNLNNIYFVNSYKSKDFMSLISHLKSIMLHTIKSIRPQLPTYFAYISRKLEEI